MDIIIHRIYKEDLYKVFKEIVCLLEKKHMDVIIDDKKLVISFNDNRITFWCSSYWHYWHMGGTRPKYYNTDSVLASEFLQQGASKVGGYEVDDLEELVDLFSRM